MKQNLLRKSLSLVLGLCILLSSVGLTAFAQPDHNLQAGGTGLVPTTEVIFSENFDGTVSTAAGSNWGTAPNTFNVTKNETTATIENGSLKVVGAAGTEKSLNLKSNTAIKGKFAVEFNFKVVDDEATPLLFGAGYTDGTTEKKAIEIGVDKFTSTDKFFRNLNYKGSDGNLNPVVDITSSWRTGMDFGKWFLLHGDGNTWAPYSRDWYTLKAVINTDNSTYSVYLNGSLCLKDEPFADSSINWATTGINLPFMMTTSHSDPLKYDSIKIYKEPVGRVTLYANDFNNYSEEISWNGTTSYRTQRYSLFAGVAGLGLANTQAKGGYIYARNNALVTEYRNGAGGAFAAGITMDDDMVLDFDFTVDSFEKDSYGEHYATITGVTASGGADGMRIVVSNDGKLIHHWYGRTIPYEPTILTNITLDEPHHMTVYMDFETYTSDIYIDGVLIDENRNLLYYEARKGESFLFKNGEDLTILFGYHKESPTTDITYDNLRLYRDVREEVFSAAATELSSLFSSRYVLKGDANLPATIPGIDGYNIKWSSNSPLVKIGADGHSAVVTPKEENTAVRLTAKVTDASGQYTATRSFDVEVTADDTITDLSSLENWKTVQGTPLLEKNPTNEVDKTVKVVPSSEAYTVIESCSGIVEATAQLYMSKESAGSIYLADNNGNAFAKINLNKSVVSAGEDGVIKSHSYPSKKWFDLTVKADMLKRTYDVFIDGAKVNNASIPFDEVSDNGTLARVGFNCSEGSVFVNDVTAKSLSANSGLEVKKISYKNSSAKAVNAPSAGGKVTSVEVSNTLTNQPAVVFVAVYGADGSMVDFGKATYDSLPTGKTTVTFTDVDIPSTWNNNCEVKAFVWNGTSKIVPLTDTHGEKLLPTIYIAGDSSAADYGTESYPYTGWGTEFKSLINENIDVVNMAQADASTSDIISGRQLNEIAKRILPGDYLFISSAYDDAAEGISEEAYKANLKTIAATATENGANVVFVTSPAPQSKDISTYVFAMKTVASELDAPVLDLNDAWAGFLADTDDDNTYYGKNIDTAMKSDSRWDLSAQNSASGNYTASLAGKDGRLSPAGAQKAAVLIASELKSAGLPISSYTEIPTAFTYSVSGGVLTINGSGDMPVYASFSETPWASATGVTTVKVSDGITSVSTDAFSGLAGLKEVYLADSVIKLGKDAFPASGYTIYGSNNTVGMRYAEEDPTVKFAFKQIRILGIGNSHTQDHYWWKDLLFEDLKAAGLKTEIVYDYLIIGGAQLMYKDILYTGVEGEYRSHYVQGSNPNRQYYNASDKLRANTYDVVLVQDYRESVMDKYKYTFANDLTKVMRWVREEQPNADVAWISDWSDMNSTGQVRENIRSQFENNALSVMRDVMALPEDGPDFIVPMGTALTNARTSYLEKVYNASDVYTYDADTNWGGSANIHKYTLLERDGTHVSYELGRYLVSAAVYGKVFDVYKKYLIGAENIDFFNALKTTPEHVVNGTYHWKGEMTDNHMAIVRESARNAILYPNQVTDSIYTVDPADGIATSVAGLSYPTFTAEGIASTVNSANLGITISASDVAVSGDSATVTFLHGYTKKTVTVTK